MPIYGRAYTQSYSENRRKTKTSFSVYKNLAWLDLNADYVFSTANQH